MTETGGGQVITPDPSYFTVFHSNLLDDKSGNRTQLGDFLDAQYQKILNVYNLKIELPEPVEKPRSWRLDLSAADRAKSELQLIYPNKLYPCI